MLLLIFSAVRCCCCCRCRRRSIASNEGNDEQEQEGGRIKMLRVMICYQNFSTLRRWFHLVLSFFSCVFSFRWHTANVIQAHVSERVYILFVSLFWWHSFLISSQSLCHSVIFLHEFDRTVKLVGYFRIKKTFIVISQRMKMA